MLINDISVFGKYKSDENTVTAAFLQVLKSGERPLILFIADKIGINLPSSEIVVETQVKNSGDGIIDGLVSSGFCFNLFIESKLTKSPIDKKQLQRHIKNLVQHNSYLIYITPHNSYPKELLNISNVYWTSWREIIGYLNEYLQTSLNENKILLEFLVGHFETLLTDLNLLNGGWGKVDGKRVLIVAAGWAESVAQNSGFYICQNHRYFKPSKYIAFYNQEISYYSELNTPQDDVNLLLYSIYKNYIKTYEPNYNGVLRRVFKLGPIKQIGPIANDALDKNGKPCPFTYGQPRYTTVDKLINSIKTSQLL